MDECTGRKSAEPKVQQSLLTGKCLRNAWYCDPGQPREAGTGHHGIHMLTSEEHGSTHYFFTAARWNVKTDAATDEAERERIAKMRRFAFQEQDAPVIEQQQRVLDKATRQLVPVILNTDAGPVRYKRILERMLAAEA